MKKIINEEKNMKKRNIIYIVILVAISILPFLKIYHEVGVLPGFDQGGNFITVKNDYWYSCFENLRDGINLTSSIIITAVFEALVVLSIIFTAIDFKKEIKAKNILFIVSLVLFSIMMFFAVTIARNY